MRAIVAASVPKPMYSANVHSWIEILLVGTPLPAQSGGAADAVAAPVAPMQAASRPAARRPRSTRLKGRFMDPPIPVFQLGRNRRRCARDRRPQLATPFPRIDTGLPLSRVDLCLTRDRSGQTTTSSLVLQAVAMLLEHRGKRPQIHPGAYVAHRDDVVLEGDA